MSKKMTKGAPGQLVHQWLPIKGGVVANLFARLKHFRKQITCKHTHTFTFCLDGASWVSSGVQKGRHSGLRLRGCYLCSQVWVEDWQA
jgi:hypothetical protein